MNKIIAGIFVLIYLVTSSNVTINLHYCCNNLVDVAINSDAGCGHGPSEKEGFTNHSCCTDDVIVSESENHVSSVEDSNLEVAPVFYLIQPVQRVENLVSPKELRFKNLARAGPKIRSHGPIYLVNSSLVLYA
ncbi:MAG: hypothetical protein ACI9J3_003280 [Parvicellaceae bacterium]|jgi:hypothetical protein